VTAGQALVWFGSTVVIAIVAWIRTDARSRYQWVPPVLVIAGSCALALIATHI